MQIYEKDRYKETSHPFFRSAPFDKTITHRMNQKFRSPHNDLNFTKTISQIALRV